MASYLCIAGCEMPSFDGVTPSRTFAPGDTVEADKNPAPAFFDPVDGTPNAPNPTTADVAATTTNEPPAAVTEGTE